MNEIEKQLKAAFDSVEVPEGLNGKTLDWIESMRSRQENDSPTPHPTDPSKRKRKTKHARLRIGLAAAACLVVALVGAVGLRVSSTPTAYVGIDMNPSIELELNRFNRVIHATGLNDEGKQIVDQVDTIGLSYEETLEAITQSSRFAQYMDEDSYVQVSVACDDSQQENDILQKSESQLSALPCEQSCTAVNHRVHQEATEAGMGMGRYLAALDAIEADPSLTLDECSHLSMRELRNIAASSTSEAKEETGHRKGSDSESRHSGNGHRYEAHG